MRSIVINVDDLGRPWTAVRSNFLRISRDFAGSESWRLTKDGEIHKGASQRLMCNCHKMCAQVLLRLSATAGLSCY